MTEIQGKSILREVRVSEGSSYRESPVFPTFPRTFMLKKELLVLDTYLIMVCLSE